LALGLMAKPMLVTTPLVLLLLDYWPLGRWQGNGEGEKGREGEGEKEAQSGPKPRDSSLRTQASSLRILLLEKVPLFVLAAVVGVGTLRVQAHSGAMGMLGGKLTLATRMGNGVCAYGIYLEKMFWPLPLSAIYPYVTHKMVDVLIIGAALAAMSVAVCRLASIKPYLPFGWWWYVVTLLPVIGLVQVGVQSMADRYTYIPLIGLFIIAAWGGAELIEGLSAAGKTAAVAGAGLLLGACAWLTSQQLVTWSSSEILFNRAVAAAPDNSFARNALGQSYWREGRLDKAKEQFDAIVKMESDPHLRVEGGFETAHVNLGLLLAVQHQPRAALKQFDKAIELQPQAAEPLRHKAWLLATYPDESHPSEKVRDGDQAVRLAEEALKLSYSKPPEFWDTLAVARAETGNFKEAIEAEQKAIDEARRMRADDMLPELEGRLKLFNSNERYHAEPQRPSRM
jgi:tetratricopeptide (TPR) repeat protein